MGAGVMIEAGKVLQQRYRIDKQIGQGGMGAVYVATDERFGSTVAIKETLCMDDNFRKAIEREARLLNSLKHAALPRVSDHFLEDNGQFLVMEYIPGEDLFHILEDQEKPFEVDQVLIWADQLLDALDFLHNQEIPVIHRDIKPQNLKLTAQGQVILLDFGLAKGNPTDAGHQTAAKSIFGYSRNYASLEQIQGTGTDPRSDLYSLAATLYHLLTGVAPEDALTRAMSVLSQKPDPLVPASSLRPAIPRGVAGVLQRALDLNAGERPASAAEMRQMFRESSNYAYLADASTVTTPPTEANVFAQKTKLMPEGTQAATGVKADLATEVMPANVSELTAVRQAASTGAGGKGTSQPESRAETESPRSRRPMAMAAGFAGLLLFGAAIAGGLYVARPSLFGGQTPAAQAPTAPAVSTAPAAANVSVDANSASATANATTGDTSAIASQTAEEKAKAATANEKPVDTAKTAKVQPAGKGTANTEEITIPVDDGDLPGDVVITKQENGKTTTMRVTPTGPRPQMPPPGTEGNPWGIDMSKLTPVQRKKLREAIRLGQVPPIYIPPKQP